MKMKHAIGSCLFFFLGICFVSGVFGTQILFFANQEIRRETLGFIQDARYSLDVCVYGISDPEVLYMLQERVRQGVRVRIITENQNAMEVYGIQGAVVIVDDDAGLMHTKYMISDETRVWCGSANLTTTSLDRHANHIFFIDQPHQVQRFMFHFEQSFLGIFKSQRAPAYPKHGIFFGPEDDPFLRIMEVLETVQHELLIGVYAFTDYRIANFLMILSSKGIHVRTLADPSWNLSNPSSAIPKIVHFSPVVLANVEGALFHDKYMIVDRTIVLFGSYNFTEAASSRNDEVLMISSDPALVSGFLAHFFSFQPDVGGVQ